MKDDDFNICDADLTTKLILVLMVCTVITAAYVTFS